MVEMNNALVNRLISEMKNVAAKDMLQHLVNRYCELTECYNGLNEAVNQMLQSS